MATDPATKRHEACAIYYLDGRPPEYFDRRDQAIERLRNVFGPRISILYPAADDTDEFMVSTWCEGYGVNRRIERQYCAVAILAENLEPARKQPNVAEEAARQAAGQLPKYANIESESDPYGDRSEGFNLSRKYPH